MAARLVTSELAAYEFLRLLGSYPGGAILAEGTAKRGDRVKISRKVDFHVKDDKGSWTGNAQKIAVVESVVMEQDIVASVVATMDTLVDPDTFSEAQIYPLAKRFGQVMITLRNQGTLVMAAPAYDADTASFTAAGNGLVVGVRKLRDIDPSKVHFEFRVVFGVVGGAARVAGIFSRPAEKEITALLAEKRRLTELLAKRRVGGTSLPKDVDDWRRIMDDSIREITGMSPWVSDPDASKIGDTIKVRKPPRYTFSSSPDPSTQTSPVSKIPPWIDWMFPKGW